MAGPLRRERVTELVHHELSDILQREIRDPRLGWATVTRVEMSPDLCYAKVYVSVFGDDEQAQEQSLRVLERASAFIRSQLGRRVRLRQTPELHFKLDHSLEHSQRVMDILKEIEIPPEPESEDSGDADPGQEDDPEAPDRSEGGGAPA